MKTTESQSQPAPKTASIKVAVVEDDVRVRGSLARMLDSSEGFNCVSQHPSGENALTDLPVTRPEVVLMDINLPGMNGVECTRRLKQLLPETQIVMLTVYENTNIIFDALAAGACGYMLKESTPEQLLQAVREVHGGGSPMTSHIARKIVASFQKIKAPQHDYEKLSLREQQVLDYLSQAYTYAEIAEVLKIRYHTVHTHIRHIYEKLHVRSRTEAVTIHLSRMEEKLPSVQ